MIVRARLVDISCVLTIERSANIRKELAAEDSLKDRPTHDGVAIIISGVLVRLCNSLPDAFTKLRSLAAFEISDDSDHRLVQTCGSDSVALFHVGGEA